MGERIAEFLVMVLFVAPAAFLLLVFALGIVASMFTTGKVKRGGPSENFGGDF